MASISELIDLLHKLIDEGETEYELRDAIEMVIRERQSDLAKNLEE